MEPANLNKQARFHCHMGYSLRNALQSRKKLKEQGKVIQAKLARTKKLRHCFWVALSSHGQGLICGREAGRCALRPTNFEILLSPKLPKSWCL